EDVGLVNLRELLAALAGELKGNARDTNDFIFRVTHRVDSLAGFFAPGARLAEVEATEELAHEEDVDALRDLGTQRRVVSKRGEGQAGAQIRIASEDLADLQQAGFGALVRRQVIELVVADRAQKDRVGVERDVNGLLGQWRAFGSDGDAADERLGELEVETARLVAEFGDGLEDVDGLSRDLG